MGVVRTIAESGAKSRALQAMAPHLSADLIPTALEMARAFVDAQTRAQVLTALGRYEEAMESGRAIVDETSRIEFLAMLSPRLGWDPIPGALTEARAIADPRRRALVLTALGRYEEALESLRAIVDEQSRHGPLGVLVYRVHGDAIPATLEAVQLIKDESWRAHELMMLASRLSGDSLDAALGAARSITEPAIQALALAGLAPRLAATGRIKEAMEAARTLVRTDSGLVAEVLAALAPYLDRDLLQAALKEARTIAQPTARAMAMGAVAPYLPADLLPEALEGARAIADDGGRWQAQASLASRLAASGHAGEALALARPPADMTNRTTVLEALAHHLPDEWIPDTLTAALEITDEVGRSVVLEALAPRLRGVLPSGTLEAARGITDPGRRARTLATLGHEHEALEVARAIADAWTRAHTIATLGRPEEALEAALKIADERFRMMMLEMLASNLSQDLLRVAIDAARAISDESSRFFTLIRLVPRLWASGPADTALACVPTIEDQVLRGSTLAELAPRLDAALLPLAIEMAQTIEEDNQRDHALAALVPRLAALGSPADSLDASLAIAHEPSRGRALIALAPDLGEDLLTAAIQAARGIVDEELRSEVLAALIPRLAAPGAVGEAMESLREIKKERYRAKALAALAPHMGAQLLPMSLRIAQTLDDDGGRAEALGALATHLAKLSPVVLVPLWEETLRLSAIHSRVGLLADLSALAPVVAALGGANALIETCRAIEDVGRWWP